jgi:peptidylprolyl isomerase/FKBP-type peptidyl-prolyl cis-trans isomerase SlpA
MATAEQGDTVRVEYTGKLQDGTVFDSSEDTEPLEFTLGDEAVIPGFEEAVEGLEVGESVTTTLEPEMAYGERRDDLVFQVDRSDIRDDIELEVGDELEIHGRDGNTFPALVQELGNEKVTLDANHPLAGRTLVFEIELVEVV